MRPKPHQRQELQEGGHVGPIGDRRRDDHDAGQELQEGGHVGPIGDRRRDDHDAGHEERLDVYVGIDAALKDVAGPPRG